MQAPAAEELMQLSDVTGQANRSALSRTLNSKLKAQAAS